MDSNTAVPVALGLGTLLIVGIAVGGAIREEGRERHIDRYIAKRRLSLRQKPWHVSFKPAARRA